MLFNVYSVNVGEVGYTIGHIELYKLLHKMKIVKFHKLII